MHRINRVKGERQRDREKYIKTMEMPNTLTVSRVKNWQELVILTASKLRMGNVEEHMTRTIIVCSYMQN